MSSNTNNNDNVNHNDNDNINDSLKEKDTIILTCPHCQESIIIEQLNCRIFRHAVLKATNSQINPHASQNECEYYLSNNLIYGCGKPFKVIDNKDGNLEAIICEYI